MTNRFNQEEGAIYELVRERAFTSSRFFLVFEPRFFNYGVQKCFRGNIFAWLMFWFVELISNSIDGSDDGVRNFVWQPEFSCLPVAAYHGTDIFSRDTI